MRYTLCLWLFVAALAGCASSYTLSAEGVKYRDYLSEEDAFRRVRKNILKSGEQAGLCAAHTDIRFAQAEPVEVDPPYLVFSSLVRDLPDARLNASAAAGTAAMPASARKAIMKINLNQVETIRVEDDPNAFGCAGSASRSLRGFIVMVDGKEAADARKGEPQAVMINVSRDNLDLLLAALSFLSPKAKILEEAWW